MLGLRRVASAARLRASTASLSTLSTSSSSSGSSNSGDSASSSSFRRQALAILAGGALLSAGLSVMPPSSSPSRPSSSSCCGIAGVVGTPPSEWTRGGPAAVPAETAKHDKRGARPAREFLVEGLTVLKNRGYDSAGLATVGPLYDASGANPSVGLLITKYASKGDNADGVELVGVVSEQEELRRIPEGMKHVTGIAHTRWATHGGKTDENAHPHVDSSGKIAIVHNGTINNANELREELQKKGHVFSSETDTEVIAKLIGAYRDELKLSVRDATERALGRCDGSWGLCVLCKDTPGELVVACNGSPLVIGIGRNVTYVASETSAFNRYTKEFISMKDGEIGVLHADGRTLDLSRVQVAADQKIILSPAPHPHWTIKECLEQPEAIARALAFGGRLSPNEVKLGGPDAHTAKLANIRSMNLTGCGTSLYAAMYGAKLMRHIGAFQTVFAIDAGETTAKDLPADGVDKSGVIVVSQSGETKDVQRVVNMAMEKGYPVLSVVNSVGSLIARTTKLGVYLNAGRENAVASTKAFTTQVTVLALLALWFRQKKDALLGKSSDSADTQELSDALMRLPICFGMAVNTREKCQKIAARLKGKEHLFVLGKGYAEPVALEGALKIKEMTYLHAEGYSGGALKHGPFALIENSTSGAGKGGATPIILIILDDEHRNSMRTAAEEVKARGAEVIIITDNAALAKGLCDEESVITIPSNGALTALIAVLPLQFIAYELALLKGINPDTPRNLAKAVTVD